MRGQSKRFGSAQNMAFAESARGRRSDRPRDAARMRTQMQVIRDVMLSAAECETWLSLREIAGLTRYGEASISAQLRHLRKPQFGKHIVEKRRRRPTPAGDTCKAVVWEYRLRRFVQVSDSSMARRPGATQLPVRGEADAEARD